MYNNSTNQQPICIYHHNPYIIGVCNSCGKYLCKDCAMHTNESSLICPDCYNKALLFKKAHYQSRKKTAIMLLVLGILAVNGLFATVFFLPSNSSDIQTTITLAETGKEIDLTWLYISLAILQILCTFGFFFGLQTFIRSVKKLPLIVIIFSFLFCMLIVWVALTFSYIAGWICMILKWRNIQKEKHDYEFSLNFYQDFCKNNYIFS